MARTPFAFLTLYPVTCRSGTITSSGNQCSRKAVAHPRRVCCSRLRRILARLLISGKSSCSLHCPCWGLVGFGLSVSSPLLISLEYINYLFIYFSFQGADFLIMASKSLLIFRTSLNVLLIAVKRDERKLSVVHTRNAINPLAFGDIVSLLNLHLLVLVCSLLNLCNDIPCVHLFQPIISLDLWEVRKFILSTY